ncbi:MAG: hypothetical protein IKM59_01760 [Oscillospiraceae bacterium]|nr:hypothetical protein [Oscillospiraceae bacterium]
MFAYCSNSPVNYADHSGYFPLGAAIELLDEWLSGDGDDQLYEEDSEIVKALNKSDKMHRFIDWAIDNYKKGKPLSFGTEKFTADEDGYNLNLSTQQFSYVISVKKESRR